MNDIGKQVKQAFGAAHEKSAPSFDDVWLAAEKAYGSERRRYTVFGGVAAALAVVVVGVMSTNNQPSDEYLIADALLNTTQWSAPSDVLLPQRQYDIYGEMPLLVEPMNSDEGLFL